MHTCCQECDTRKNGSVQPARLERGWHLSQHRRPQTAAQGEAQLVHVAAACRCFHGVLRAHPSCCTCPASAAAVSAPAVSAPADADADPSSCSIMASPPPPPPTPTHHRRSGWPRAAAGAAPRRRWRRPPPRAHCPGRAAPSPPAGCAGSPPGVGREGWDRMERRSVGCWVGRGVRVGGCWQEWGVGRAAQQQ